MFKKLLSITFLAAIIWASSLSSMAFSGLAESRINNLESRFYRLESQINRIEAELNRADVSKLKIPNNPSSQRRPTRLSYLGRDKMFDRLATLVIESKQDIKDLQKRVSQLEKADNS